MKILITGGAGFIGSHLTDALVGVGHEVVVFDNLDPQIHGSDRHWPAYLPEAALLFYGDVRDRSTLAEALRGVRVVYHMAAQTGVGQSMYQIDRYTGVNVQGTAVLLDLLANGAYPVEKLILASSRAAYGEGAYSCPADGLVYPGPRPPEQLKLGMWEPRCPSCGGAVEPVATSEDAPIQPGSVYALTKSVQESLCQLFGQAYGVDVVILRYFNVYGPRQSLSNPYTGILSIFTSAIKEGNAPEVYEDGLESRDFVYVRDAVRASLLALDVDGLSGRAINVGSGQRSTILRVAETLMHLLGMDGRPLFRNRFRIGDIRHCFAELTQARTLLGYEPTTALEQGIRDFLAWAEYEDAPESSAEPEQTLVARGILR